MQIEPKRILRAGWGIVVIGFISLWTSPNVWADLKIGSGPAFKMVKDGGWYSVIRIRHEMNNRSGKMLVGAIRPTTDVWVEWKERDEHGKIRKGKALCQNARFRTGPKENFLITDEKLNVPFSRSTFCDFLPSFLESSIPPTVTFIELHVVIRFLDGEKVVLGRDYQVTYGRVPNDTAKATRFMFQREQVHEIDFSKVNLDQGNFESVKPRKAKKS